MDERKEEESTPADTGEGDKPKENTLVDDTNLAAKRLEDATAAAKEERLAREDSYNKMKLGGKSEAGQEPVVKTDDDKWKEDAKERYEGTGLDPTEDDTPTTYS